MYNSDLPYKEKEKVLQIGYIWLCIKLDADEETTSLYPITAKVRRLMYSIMSIAMYRSFCSKTVALLYLLQQQK